MYRPTGGHLNPQSSHTPHGLTLLASLADQSSLTRLTCASLPPRLLCSLRSPPAYRLPLLLSLRSRLICLLPSPCLLLASLALPAVHFARRLSRCSLHSSPLLLSACYAWRFAQRPSVLHARSARQLACCSRFARQLACCSLRSLPLLPLASLAAGCWPLRLQLASLAPAGSAHRLTRLGPCPPRLLLHLFSAPCTGARSGQTCRIP